MGMAEMAVALWGPASSDGLPAGYLKHNPGNPQWFDRDRFVLSNGHASMLLYALLHLTGYALPMEELKHFRQLHSKTPGHPEHGLTPGVETTTGPLGQGFANAVGMALAEKLLAAEFNREDHAIVDHHTYVFMGDGCMMEGVSHEAAALAGAWKLNKLVALYDDNGISIDGPVAPWFVDNTALRFVAYGWNVIGPIQGNDTVAVSTAIAEARSHGERPTLIMCKTRIGQGSPNRANTAKAHGEPLGADEIVLTREALGWSEPPFVVPQDIYAAWDAKTSGERAETDWNARFATYRAAFPELAAELARRMQGELPRGFAQTVVDTVIGADQKAETVASRKASQLALESFTAALPEMLGGSADLTGSNLTNTKSTPSLRFDLDGAVVKTPDAQGVLQDGRHINYGVREFGMAAVMNGIALHGGYIPYGGTFLTFSDYSRNAIRMAALMKLRVVHVFTTSRPTALLLSRQNISYAPKGHCAAAPDAAGLDAINKGAYVLAEPTEVGLRRRAQAVIIATGSEVQLALKAQELLATRKIAVRVVSMPSTTTFDRQPVAYKTEVLPAGLPRIAVEMGVTDGWWKYGCAAVVGIDTYGESAPAPVLFKYFGFTPENVADTVQKVLAKR